jgi:hypothetical protein
MIVRWCSGKTSRGVSRISHYNPGWRIAFENADHAGGQKQVIDPYVAMQQIVDKDPWLHEPLSQKSRSVCESADNVKGDPW